MNVLRAQRERLGLSQRDLAARAGVAFRTVQLLERGRHDARLSTLAKLSEALGQPKENIPRAVEACFIPSGDSVADVSRAIARKGDASWKLHLFNFVDAFRRAPFPALIEAPPSARASPKVLALLASTVERLCAEQGMAAPLWCAGVGPLPSPWFVAGIESLKALALVESPAQFRRRRVFVLGNFLDRI